MPSHPATPQMRMCPLGFHCFGLRTAAAASEAPLLLLKPSESPKEDSQAPAQAVTIVIRADKPAPEPRAPKKCCPEAAVPPHPTCRCRDARGRHARDTCAAVRARGAALPAPSRRPVAPFWVGKKGFTPGEAPFSARVASVLGATSPSVSFLRPEGDVGAGYGVPSRRRSGRNEQRD